MVSSCQRRARSVADGGCGLEHEPPRSLVSRLGRRVRERDGISCREGGAAALGLANALIGYEDSFRVVIRPRALRPFVRLRAAGRELRNHEPHQATSTHVRSGSFSLWT